MSKILIADDHDLVLESIAAYLRKSETFVVETVSSLDQALEELSGLTSYDLAILDYNMPGMDKLNGLERAIKAHPVTKFVLMSGVANPDVARKAMSFGAVGFFPKSLAAETMVNAVRFILAGEKYFPFDLVSTGTNGSEASNHMGLSTREMQTLRRLCEGKSNKEIARDLDLQEVTIKLHVKNILSKLGVKNRTQAALRARDEGII